MAAADDGLFLKIFSRRNKNGVPGHGLAITSLLISLLLLLTISSDLVNQFKVIILIATLTALVPYLYTPVAEIILFARERSPMSKKTLAVAIITIVYSFWAMTGAGQDVLSLGALFVMSSIPLYLFATGRRKSV